MSYFDKNPIQKKSVAKDWMDMFCRSEEMKLRLACAISRDGHTIHQTVGIKDMAGRIHHHVIILN